jgi:UDP-glucose 4-epimerase
MSDKATILVVGGAGYIGSHTVHLLAQQGYHVIVLDNLVYGHRAAIIDSDVVFVQGDLGDRDVLEPLFSEYAIDAVMHFAAYAYVGESVQNPAKYYHNNLSKPLILLDTMRDYQCGIFIFSSTCATFGNPQYIPIDEQHPQNPINPYGATKLMLERVLDDYAAAYGIRYACLRYFNAAGASPEGRLGEDHEPETHLIPLVLAAADGRRDNITIYGTDYATPDGTCIRDYIHVHDLARAHIFAYQYMANGHPPFKCNLGTGKGHSVKEVIEVAQQVTGKSIPVHYGKQRLGDPPELIADPTYARKLIAWEAEIKELESIVATAWNWMQGPNRGRYQT